MRAHPISTESLFIWILIVIISLVMVLKIQKNPLDYHTNTESKSMPSDRAFQFEMRKLNEYLAPSLRLMIFIMIVCSFIGLTYTNSIKHVDQLTNEQSLETNQMRRNIFQEQRDTLLATTKEEDYEIIKMNIEYLEGGMNFYDQFSKRWHQKKDAYLQDQSQVFYSLVEKDQNLHFGTDMTSAIAYRYYIKPQHYESGEMVPSKFTEVVSRERVNLLKQRQIYPIVNVEVVHTPYDITLDKKEFGRDQLSYQAADLSWLNMLYHFISHYQFDIILIILIILLFGAAYTLEKDSANHLGFLYTLPKDRLNILKDKAKAMIGVSIGSSLIIIGILGIVSLFMDGIGAWNFPIIRYLAIINDTNDTRLFNESYEWIDLGIVIVESILLIIAVLIFVLMLSLLISLFVRSKSILFGLLALILYGGYALSLNIPFGEWLPFIYLDVSSIVDGTILFKINNGHPTVLMGGIILIMCGIGCYLLSVMVIKKKWRGVQSL